MISALRDGFERLAPDGRPNQMEGWRLKLEASRVPELQPAADGLARLEGDLRSDGVDLGEQVRDLASTEIGRGVSLGQARSPRRAPRPRGAPAGGRLG